LFEPVGGPLAEGVSLGWNDRRTCSGFAPVGRVVAEATPRLAEQTFDARAAASSALLGAPPSTTTSLTRRTSRPRSVRTEIL
jgi:hypothetical protein